MDSEKQKDEIIALGSIYNTEEFFYYEENDHYQCTFKIFISLPIEYYVTYTDYRHTEEPLQKIQISHLPPLTLYVILPKDYPSASPPEFTLFSSWLYFPLLEKLCKKLDQLWEENKGQEILFTWVGFLHDETLEFLNIQESINISNVNICYQVALEEAQSVLKNKVADNVDGECNIEDVKNKAETNFNIYYASEKGIIYHFHDKRAILGGSIRRNPVEVLINYNKKRNRIEFKKNFNTCKICFVDKLGEHCTQFLPCTHVFCKDCITGYLEVRIKDGNVQNIYCPEEKCSSEATPSQIKELVSSELFAKYDSILLSVTLDTMKDIIYCPRRTCQYPVSCEPNEPVGNCPVCQYAFCIYCKMGYHGVEQCKIYLDKMQQILTEYRLASTKRRLEMEQRYGKKQIVTLIENSMSENWIKTNSQKCPKCDVAIEKLFGCNMMVCCRCDTKFCWLCSAILDRFVPYKHYQNSKSSCFNMLYHGVIE